MIDEQLCLKCGCIDWDHANVGLIGAIVCTNCGEIYMMKEQETMTMTESEFEAKFDNGDFDCEYAQWICETYDAWGKHQMLALWEDPDVYVAFMETKVTAPSTMLQDTYFGGVNPLDSFPSIRGDNK